MNALYTSDFGTQTNAQVAATVVSNLGITGDAATIATNVITADLNAAVAGQQGATIAGILNGFATMTGNAVFGSFATAWETKVGAADAASSVVGAGNQQLGNISTNLTTNGFTNGLGASATFITGVSVPAGALILNDLAATATDTITAPTGSNILASQLTINGGSIAGVGDAIVADVSGSAWSTVNTLTVNGSGAETLTLKAGQGSVVANSANGGVAVNGGTSVTVNSNGTTVIGGGAAATDATGAITVINASAGSGTAVGAATTVNGGTTQTITGSGNITLSKSTGAISVTENTVVTGNTGAAIAITGGTTVNVAALGASVNATTGVATLLATQNAGSISVGAATAIATNATTGQETITAGNAPTGNVVISQATNGLALSTSTAQTTYYNNAAMTADVLGATSVSLSGGTVTAVTAQNSGHTATATGGIVDLATTLLAPATGGTRVAGTSTLASVSLAGVSGAVAIVSDALTSLTINDSTAVTTYGQSAVTAVTVTNNTADHALAITLSNDATGTTVTDAIATSVTISTGAATLDGAATSAVTITGAKIATETLTNAASLTVTNTSDPLLRSIVANNTGSLNLGTVASTVTSVNAAGGTGAVTAAITATATAFTGGAGNDVVTIAVAPTTKAINGGTGTNTLVWDGTAGPTNPLFLNSSVSNFNTLGMGADVNGGTVDAGGFSHLTAATALTGSGTGNTFSDVGAGVDLTVTGAQTHALTYTLANNLPASIATINIGTAAGTALIAVGTIIPTIIANVTINNLGTVAAGGTPFINTMTLADTAMTTLVVAGTEGLTLTAAGTSVTSFADTAGGTVNVTAVVASAAGATFSNAAGAFLAQGAAGLGSTDTVTGGAGAVTFVETGIGSLTATLGVAANTVTDTNPFSTGNITITAGVGSGTAVQTIDVLANSGTENITLGNGANVVTLGAGGTNTLVVGTGANIVTITDYVVATGAQDLVTFGAHTGVDAVVLGFVVDSANNTATPSTVSISTTSDAIFTGLAKGDTISFAAAHAQTQASLAANATVTAATNLAGVLGNVAEAFGTYNATAQTFTYSATGTDALVTADVGLNSSHVYTSIVLVGYHGTLSTLAASVTTLG